MHDYRFLYHYNTYSKKWGAMTADSVGHYFNGHHHKGNFVIAETRAAATKALAEKMKLAAEA